jgi:8-oxo-dGTP pyrophosphatase MutT (NUDIX family)
LGDYKFPGGGIDKNETHEQALRREVLEETGYTVTHIGEKLGEAVEAWEDFFESGKYFVMTSHYYTCEVGECAGALKLDDYERDLQFAADWITAEQAIANNELLLQQPGKDINRWVVRDTQVLKEVTGL